MGPTKAASGRLLPSYRRRAIYVSGYLNKGCTDVSLRGDAGWEFEEQGVMTTWMLNADFRCYTAGLETVICLWALMRMVRSSLLNAPTQRVRYRKT
jgi:hypothetical protein